MKLIVLGSGPTEPVKGKGKNRRTNSSCYFEIKGSHFIIDVTPQFLEQVKANNIKRIDFVLFTHAHHDAIGGIPQLIDWLTEQDVQTIDVYCEKQTWVKIKEKFKKIDLLKPHFIKPYEEFEVNGIKFLPIRVEHSIQPGFPTVAYRFNDVIYSEDLGEIPKESEKYFYNAKLWIIDAAMYFGKQIKGHQSVESALELVKKYEPKQALLIQAGHTYPDYETAKKEILEYWKQIRGDCSTKIMLAYDGMVLELEDKSREGIYLPDPHAKWLWQDKKQLIIKTENFENMVDKALYVVDKQYVYGIIRLHPPNKITRKQFEERRNLHLISDEEVKKWWGNPKEFWEYSFTWIDRFINPIRWKYKEGIQTFVKDVEFLNIELIENVKTYDPSKLPTKVLKDDWRIVLAWYTTLKTKGKFKYSEETIVNLAKLIYNELKKRGIKFHPEHYKSYALELYKIVSGSKEIINKKYDLTKPEKFLKEFKDFTVIKDVISLVGSTVKSKDGHYPHDIDLLVRIEPVVCPKCHTAIRNDFLERAIKVRLVKMLPNELAEKIHFIFGESSGPHDDYIPLYDLKLVRILPPKIIEMAINLKMFTPYLPQKPYGSAYYKIPDVLEEIEDDVEYSIEYKANGFHACIHKSGDKVKIFSEQKKDITDAFPTLIEAIRKLSKEDFIIDGELVLFEGNKVAGRRGLMKFIGAIQSGKKIDDKNVKLFVWDIIYYNKPILHLPLKQRIEYLHKLKFNNRVIEIPRKFAKGKEEVERAIKWAADLQGSEGAVIKRLDAPYSFDETSQAWIKFRHLVDIDVVVLERNPKERGLYNYTVGIYLRKKDMKIINPKKVTTFNGKNVLILGHTFNTDEKIDVGKIISILVEEVWRHETTNGIHYSIHKPRVAHVTEKKTTSTVDDLESIVQSIGFAVKKLKSEPKDEGHDIYVRDFPLRMQANFKKIMDNKLWMPFVVQVHTIGRKAHRDVRFFIPSKDYGQVLSYDEAESLFEKDELEGILEGITLFEPSTIEESNYDADKHVRGTIKVPEPIDWLFFEGVTHKIGTAGTHYPGVFTIIAKGIYTVHQVNDHLIHFELKSDKGTVNLKPIEQAKKEGAPVLLKPPKKLINMTGKYSYHIAHIEKDRWIMLWDRIKSAGKPSKLNSQQLTKIYLMTKAGFSRKSIANELSISPNTVYLYQRQLGLI